MLPVLDQAAPAPEPTKPVHLRRDPAKAVPTVVPAVTASPAAQAVQAAVAQPGAAEQLAAAFTRGPLDTDSSGPLAAYHMLPATKTADGAHDDKADADRAAERAQREQALGVDRDGKADRIRNQTTGKNAYSKAEYDALNPEQRAAVDFNRMLLEAVHRDRTHVDDAKVGGKHRGVYQPTDDQRETYDDAVEGLFGKDRGSDTFAPETVALLRQIGYHDDKAASLDDFLHLDAAIGRKQIERMGSREAPAPAAPGTKLAPGLSDAESLNANLRERYGVAEDLAHHTEAIQKSLVQGNNLLANFPQMAAVERGEDAAKMGGKATKAEPTTGYGDSSRDKYFQLTFDTMMAKDADVQHVLGLVQSEHPDDLPDFKAFAANRLQNSERYDLTEGDGSRKYEDLVKLLGLEVTP